MNKRGQFFLIAALIIIGIILSVSTVYNYTSSNNQNTKASDISKELDFEANKVIDKGVFNSDSSSQIKDNVKNLTASYSSLNPDSDIIVIYGNEAATYYTCASSGSVCLSTSCEEICSLTGVTTPITNSGNGNAFQVRIPNSNISYEFNLNSSQNFYIIVSNQRGDEQFVATN
jgi:hypothetical protein